MSNSKISALTSATTPLAGTETLPIVQSGATKQVSIANLTAGRAVSATSYAGNVLYTTALAASPASTTQNLYIYSSSGLNANAGIEWQYATSGSGYGFKMNVNGGTDTLDIGYRANSATWTKTFGFGNDGNLVPFVAAKGINFTANTPAAGMTSQLLNWYEEGIWTPDLLIAGGNTGITYTSRSGRYTRIGRMVEVECSVVLSSKGARTGAVRVGGLPFTPGIDILPATVVPTGTWAGLVVGGDIQAYISGTAVYLLLGTLTGTGSLTDINLSNTSAFTFTATFSV
jgi:hypothetical protein